MKKYTKIFLTILFLAAIFIWSEVAKSPTADEVSSAVKLYFFNVGQGDSEMIEKGDYQILIDGGPDDSVLSEIGKTMPLSDRKIDTVILTHPHADHLAGLNQILERYEIGKIYSSGVLYESNGYDEFLGEIKIKNIPVETPDVGEKISPFENGELTFLWPGKKYEGKSIQNLNNASLVARFCYFSNCTLFTGDIEVDEQAEMINYYSSRPSVSEAEKPESSQSTDPSVSNNNPFRSEILKIAHHGSSNSTNQKLLDIVKPKIAVIGVGADNKYGHPHAVVLDLLQNANIQQYRTDKDETIEFIVSQDGVTRK